LSNKKDVFIEYDILIGCFLSEYKTGTPKFYDRKY